MTSAKTKAGSSPVPLDPPVGLPEWDDDGMPQNLLASAEDADEWLALIERLHGMRRWKFSEPDSLEKLRACRAELRRFMTPNADVTGLPPAQAVELPPKPSGGGSELT